MLGILWAEIAWAALAIHLTFGSRELAGATYFLLQIASAGVLIWFGFGALREGAEPVRSSCAVVLLALLATVFSSVLRTHWCGILSVCLSRVRTAGYQRHGCRVLLFLRNRGIVSRGSGVLYRRGRHVAACRSHHCFAMGIGRGANGGGRVAAAEYHDLTGVSRGRFHATVAPAPRSRSPSMSVTTICPSAI